MHLSQLRLRENKPHVANKSIQEGSPSLTAGPLIVEANAALHHGVLTHQHRAVWAEALQHLCVTCIMKNFDLNPVSTATLDSTTYGLQHWTPPYMGTRFGSSKQPDQEDRSAMVGCCFRTLMRVGCPKWM